jgi:hypothetical protein
MYPDFKELLSVLNAHGVKYLVVGAYAVIHPRPTPSHQRPRHPGQARRREREKDLGIGAIWCAAR